MKKCISSLIIFLSAILVLFSCENKPYIENKGEIFSTYYKVTYSHSEDIKEDIVDELKKFDASLSMFNKSSVLARINNNDPDVMPDEWFTTVFNKAMQISASTNGVFDMTVAPLVNVWGFGFEKSDNVTPQIIDSLKTFVGYQKIRFENGKIIKDDPRVMLDASAIAKGYSCDVVARLMDKKGIKNYLIDIGGEMVAKGVNPKGNIWNIGINRPVEGGFFSDPVAILKLDNMAMATSGNYRRFYVKDGKKYAHTIDPHSGYPVQHSLLSATVLAKDCMTADALATSFMVMGLEKSISYVNNQDGIFAYFIYSDEDGKNRAVYTAGMGKYIVKEKELN